MPIKILKSEVASQIAAGEVVERPASVVKELVENALDAEAQQILIRIEKAGRRLIEVSDNGTGISEDEIHLAVARFATSKLETAEDLQHVRTLGFRGEALASIASVSRLTLTSCVPDAPNGVRLRIVGGKPGIHEKVGAPIGTVVLVEDLFYNVPARLKFLKTDITERRKIVELLTRYALAYPKVRFQLFQDGKPVFQTSGNGDHREILADFYGVDTAREMLGVRLDDDIQINGFTSPISVTRSNRREMTFFVNGRWVQDTSLPAALLRAYHTMLMVGRYPIAILFLEIQPEDVDVNVHPAKAEVRFQYPDRIFSTVQRAVRRALMAYSSVPQISLSSWRSAPEQRAMNPAWNMAAAADTNIATMPESAAETPKQAEIPAGELPLLRLVGQVGATYIAAEGPDGLYLVDQHAAHERVLFERFVKSSQTQIPSQALLESVILHLPPAKAQLLSEQLSILKKLGFFVEPFGPGSFQIRAIPAFLTGVDPISSVQVVVDDFEEDETPLQNEIEKRLIARVCKRAAVKGGQTLSREEQAKLLRDLEICQSPRTCPHGRPTMIHLSVDLLERQFGRRGSR
ncbi:MAG: DNA mismatch repair endonuclease MutL [Anaerolineaceae bacterium]|nr:DNA mismatch repair endonuclease MutL [Anaerolineaceae bacterium]